MLQITGSTTANNDTFGSANLVVNGGVLRIVAPTAGLANTINSSANVVMGGGELEYQYASSVVQTFTNLTLNPGESLIRVSRNGSFNTSITFTGTITRAIGATMDALELDTARRETVFSNIPATPLITTNGVAYVTLGSIANGGGATVAFLDWAQINAAHQLAAVGYTNTTATVIGTTGQNATVAVATTTLAADATVASFRDNFNTSTATVDLGTHTLTTGGILVTPNITVANSAITDGNLQGPSGQDLVVFVGANATTPRPFTISANIVDNGGSALTKGAPGTLIISGTNTFTNGVYINDGTLQLGSSGAFNSTSPNAVNFDGSGGSVAGQFGTSPNASAPTLALAGFSTTVSSLSSTNLQNGVNAVVENANGAAVSNVVLTVNGTGTTTFNGVIQDGTGGGTLALTKSGSGTLAIFGTHTYTGNTLITGGKLSVNHSLASPLVNVGAGATLDASASTAGYAVGAGKTLMGSGTVLGTLVMQAGGNLNPGDPAVNTGIGTLTVGSLTLGASSILNFDMASSSSGDLINILNNNGLVINGPAGSVALQLFQPNTSTVFTAAGTYNVFQYLGSIGGTGLAALNDPNVGAGNVGTFGTTTIGGLQFVTLTIAPSTVSNPTWALTGGGSWNVAGDWNPVGIPSGQGVKAVFDASITADSTVTLDANQTVGTITFNNSHAYTIAASGSESLILDNGASPSQVIAVSGSHVISAPVTLNGNTALTVNGGNLTVSGVISQSVAGLSVTVGGSSGTVALTNANTYTGGTFINGAILQVGNNQALGSGPVTFGSDGTLQAGAAALVLANNISIGSGVNASVNSNGQTLTLSGVISSADATGSFIKNGTGTVVVTGANTLTTPIVISQGNLQVGDGVNTTSSLGSANITANGNLVYNTVGNITLNNTISGSGNFIQNGTNLITLTAANTFHGMTINNGGAVQIAGNATNPVAQTGAGSGPITINKGSLYMDGFGPNNVVVAGVPTGMDNAPNYDTMSNGLIIPAGATATFGVAQRGTFSGSVTGSGTLNLDVQYVRGTLSGDWSGFSGQVNVVPTVHFNDVSNGGLGTPDGDFRFGANFDGSHASFDFGANTRTYASANGFTVQFGNLTGNATAVIGATGTSTGTAVFSIGALGTVGVTDTFLGSITQGNSITKVGPGILDLAGTNSFTGAIAVANGLLTFNSTGTSSVPATVSAITMGAAATTGTLDLSGTSQITTAALTTVAGTPVGNVIGSSSTTASTVINFSPTAITTTNTFSGNIVDTIGPGNQTVALSVNNGTLILSGTNTYTGGTTISSAGTLQLVLEGRLALSPTYLSRTAELWRLIVQTMLRLERQSQAPAVCFRTELGRRRLRVQIRTPA